MELNYKTLVEIKLEHEYFLTKEDGKNLFSESDQVNRMAELELAYANERESMSRDLDFVFPEKLRSIYKEFGLKLLPSYSGCRVVIRVNKKKLPDNSLVYEPFFPLPEAFEIFILLVRKNNLPETYTNGKISRSVPANFLFSNENLTVPRIFPFLVNPVQPFDSGISYEQGELAIDAGNNLQEFFYDNNGNLQQIPITSAVTTYAGENDRMLVPGKFNYTVTGNDSVTQLDISLKDSSSSIIKTFSFSHSEPFRQVILDFSDKADQLQLSENLKLPEGVFSIEAFGNNGYSEKRNIVFSNQLWSVFNLGAIHLKPRVANSLFNLITDEGQIVQRKDPMGVVTGAPVFEIPFKSRFGNFRYINNNGLELELDPSLNNFLYKEGKALISQIPVSLCRYYFMVSDNNASSTKFMPNPRSYEIKKDDSGRIYFDIMVPESDLFSII